MSKEKHLIEKIKMKAGMFAVSLTIKIMSALLIFEAGLWCCCSSSVEVNHLIATLNI